MSNKITRYLELFEELTQKLKKLGLSETSRYYAQGTTTSLFENNEMQVLIEITLK